MQNPLEDNERLAAYVRMAIRDIHLGSPFLPVITRWDGYPGCYEALFQQAVALVTDKEWQVSRKAVVARMLGSNVSNHEWVARLLAQFAAWEALPIAMTPTSEKPSVFPAAKKQETPVS
jgi:hypothetical protein